MLQGKVNLFSSINYQRTACLLILSFLPLVSWAQEFYLELQGTPTDLQVVENYRLKHQSSDSVLLYNQLTELQDLLYQEGYLAAKVNPQWKNESRLLATIDLGERYRLTKIDAGNVDRNMLQKIGFREKLFTGQSFRPQEVQELLQEIIKEAGDTGYPFATVRLDCVEIVNQEVSARLLFDPGPAITFDSTILVEPVRVNTKFLQAYLQIPPGTPFSETLVEQIPSRLSKLPYLKLTEAPGLSFQNDQASTYLSLEYIKANQIDGVVGFLPNAKADGDLLITGQFNLHLQNIFGSGRSLGFNWESFKPESQQLNIEFNQPVLFRSPIELNAAFTLFKEDSTFINREFRFDLGYFSTNRHFVGFHSQIKTARLPATTLLDNIESFPDIADFNLNQYGVIYRWDNLDDYLEPRTGLQLHMSASTGTKRIKQNSAIEDSLYQELNLESNQFSWKAEIKGFVPVSKRWVIAARWSGAGVYNDRLFFNDLYRLGGLKSLRGFSENTFFADNFAYTNLEGRFFIDTGSYLFVFYDQAWWLKYNLEDSDFKDTPSGLGAGISLTTNAGIFNFAWAVGNSKNQELGLDQSKIHFGYISRF